VIRFHRLLIASKIFHVTVVLLIYFCDQFVASEIHHPNYNPNPSSQLLKLSISFGTLFCMIDNRTITKSICGQTKLCVSVCVSYFRLRGNPATLPSVPQDSRHPYDRTGLNLRRLGHSDAVLLIAPSLASAVATSTI